MKRSQINALIQEAEGFIHQHGFKLPPFGYFSPQEWDAKLAQTQLIRQNQMGWDITDFGLGRFEQVGLVLFTLRNGHPSNLQTLKGPLYAEKLLIVQPQQLTPMHFHWHKTEDIINRGGGTLVLQLYESTANEQLEYEREVGVYMDGVLHQLPAGSEVRLEPGQSITMHTGLYHSFWAEGEAVLVGEVSNVNDDHLDNRFLQAVGRFPQIEEDVPPYRWLVGDYPKN